MSVFYLIFIALAIYFSIRYDGIEGYDSHKQHRLWLVCIYLICLAGFSYGIGGDKFSYMEEFEYYPDTFADAKFIILKGLFLRGQMPLWTIVNLVCKLLFHSFYAVQFTESIVINTAVCFFISRYTHRYFLTLLLYFLSLQYFLFNVEVMREGFALGFALIGMHCWMRGRRWQFAIMIFLALTAHISAFIVLLFPFLRFKASWLTLCIAILATFVLWAVSDRILGDILGAVMGTGTLGTKVMYYTLQTSSFPALIVHDFRYLILPYIMMYTAIIFEPSEQMRKDKERLLAFFTVLAVLVSGIPGLSRFYNYSYIFYFILTAEFIYMLFRFKEFLAIRIGTVLLSAFFVSQHYRVYYESSDSYFYEMYYPYTCILNEDADVDFRKVAHKESLMPVLKDKNVRKIE
ncbi:MAG: EpsG family protein [Bacteroidales bacterium]|nr:EpsG family protein [Bacteroidales bacterium]